MEKKQITSAQWIYEQLQRIGQDWEAEQNAFLMELLAYNAHTSYGEKYDFLNIHTCKSYQDKIPVSEYCDYEPYIERMREGKDQQLMRENPVFWCRSSGSTGKPKMIPVSARAVKHLENYIFHLHRYMQKIVTENATDKKTNYEGKCFWAGETYYTMEKGTPCGIFSNAVFTLQKLKHCFPEQEYTSPLQILFPEEVMDLRFFKLFYALKEPDVCVINSIFAHHLLELFIYLEENYTMLIQSIETGVFPDCLYVSQKFRYELEQELMPDPKRAEELRTIFCHGMNRDTLHHVWPNLQFVSTIGGGTFSIYLHRLKEYIGDIPIHHFAYAASEGVIGISLWLNQPNRYALIPEFGFFEFIPLEQEKGKRPLLVPELTEGKEYEVLLTNTSGFYRYRLKDVIRMAAWENGIPIIEFCYRLNQVINVAGEKMNIQNLEKAIHKLEENIHVYIEDYFISMDMIDSPYSYHIFLEAGTGSDMPAKDIVAVQMDECLKAVNIDYKECRENGEIGKLWVTYLKPGTGKKFRSQMENSKIPGQQEKPTRIVQEEKLKELLRAGKGSLEYGREEKKEV